MICSSEKRFFTSNLLALGNWTPDRSATQNRGDVAFYRMAAASHVPSVFPAHIVQRVANLAETMGLDRFDQRLEDVPPPTRRVLKIRQAVAVLEPGHSSILNHVGV